jgi:hypothetical protein
VFVACGVQVLQEPAEKFKLAKLDTPTIGQVGVAQAPQALLTNVAQEKVVGVKQVPAPPVGVTVIVTLSPEFKEFTEYDTGNPVTVGLKIVPVLFI